MWRGSGVDTTTLFIQIPLHYYVYIYVLHAVYVQFNIASITSGRNFTSSWQASILSVHVEPVFCNWPFAQEGTGRVYVDGNCVFLCDSSIAIFFFLPPIVRLVASKLNRLYILIIL